MLFFFEIQNLGTTISPWIVTMEALEPFRVAGPSQDDPPILDYLKSGKPGAYDIHLEAHIETPKGGPFPISHTNFKHMVYLISFFLFL